MGEEVEAAAAAAAAEAETAGEASCLVVDADAIATDLITKNKAGISAATLLKDIAFKKLEGEASDIGGFMVKLSISK